VRDPKTLAGGVNRPLFWKRRRAAICSGEKCLECSVVVARTAGTQLYRRVYVTDGLAAAAAAIDQKLGALLRMHELAFTQWGCGRDSLRLHENSVDRRRQTWRDYLERRLLDFARYRGFTPPLCRAYRRY